MSKNVTLGQISNIITGPFGSQLHMSDYVDTGIPVIMPQDIVYGSVSMDNIAYIREVDYLRLLRYAVQPNDIIFARRGDIEKHAFITESNQLLCGTGCFRVRITDSKVYPIFLSYFLDRLETKKWLTNHAVGSNMPNLNTDILAAVPIKLPDYEEQIKIGDFLYNIDKKIKCNKKINDNLQSQLKLMYDYWFTQFDFPDENGKPYRSSGGAMVWNKQIKRKIPVNWCIGSIANNSLLQIIKPGIEKFDEKIYLATADVVGTDIMTGSVVKYHNRENRANMQPMVDSIWFAKMKNSVKHLYFNSTMKSIIDNVVLSTGFCGLQCSKLSFEYIASFIEHSYFETIKNILAHGATQEAINNDDLYNIALVIPPNNVIQLYHERTKEIYAQISNNICEIRKLTTLRDWLLPMLMNGQAKIKEHTPETSVIQKLSVGFDKWLANQCFAARGDVDMDVLRDIYEAMDDDDKEQD